MIKSPINYMGSKFNLLEHLIPLFPKTETFVDLFAGGGSVYMNVSEMYENVIVNDKIKQVIEIHKNLNNDDFLSVAINRSIETIDSQDAYMQLRNEFNSTKSAELLLALIWSCNSNMMRFNKSGDFNQTWGKRGFNDAKKKILDAYRESVRLDNIKFISMDYAEVLIPDNSFVYLDPPYSNTEAGYNAVWDGDERLIDYIELLMNMGVKFGLSGVINEKENKVFDHFRNFRYNDVQIHFFGEFYKKIAKKERINDEFYITNCGG